MMEPEKGVSARKRVLVISNLYHSSPRIPAICRHLHEFGWDVTIVTPHSDKLQGAFNAPSEGSTEGVVVLETGESRNYEQSKSNSKTSSLPRRLKGLAAKLDPAPDSKLKQFLERNYWRAYGVLHYPDTEIGWYGPALQLARRSASDQRYDVILSSSSPVVCHMVAGALSAETGIPWVAEFRDLWSQNHNLATGRFVRFFAERLERRTIADARALVTVSPIWVEELRKLHARKEVVCVTNGYEPLSASLPIPKATRFTISYTGQIYSGRQDPSRLFRAIRQLIDEGVFGEDEIEVRLFGPHNDRVQSLRQELGLEPVVRPYGVVPREESIKRQMESHLLLLLNWEDDKEFGVIPLKFFEYLATGTPILATGGKKGDAIDALIAETRAGWLLLDDESLRDRLKECFSEFKAKGAITIARNEERVGAFSYPQLARAYAGILDGAAKR